MSEQNAKPNPARTAEQRLAALIKVIWLAPDFYTMPRLRAMICEEKL